MPTAKFTKKWTIISLIQILLVSTSMGQIVNNISFVDVHSLGRAGIARLLDSIKIKNPKIVAIDLQFSERVDYGVDYQLALALDRMNNLLMISMIEGFTGAKSEYSRFMLGSQPEFLVNAKTGFANTIFEDDRFRTLKRFSVWEKVNGEIEYHFAVRIAMEWDSLKAVKFVRSNPKIIEVDYKNGLRKFVRIVGSDIMKGKVPKDCFEGKIVMLGYLSGEGDKFFTPLNKNKKNPDMYGLEYLANIVSQVLESK